VNRKYDLKLFLTPPVGTVANTNPRTRQKGGHILFLLFNTTIMFRRNRQQQQRQNNNRRSDHHRRGRSDPSSSRRRHEAPTIVGTEAAAKENLERNRREFKYPEGCAFEVPIEHSLIYNMLKEPEIYPRDVVVQHLSEEDFSQYLYYAPLNCLLKKKRDNGGGDGEAEDERLVSYAQLSALLGLSAEHYAPLNDDNEFVSQYQQKTQEEIKAEREKNDVTKILGKRVLQTVIRYATEHDLDREVEANELLEPFSRYIARRNASAEMKAVASLYAGYSAMILTGNPLLGMAGLAVWSTQIASRDSEMRNFETMQKETSRKANVETAGLLDEADDL